MKFPVYRTLLLSVCLFNILCWLKCILTGEPLLPRSDEVNEWAETLLLVFSIVGAVGSAVHIAMYIAEKHAECMLRDGKELVRKADLWLDRAIEYQHEAAFEHRKLVSQVEAFMYDHTRRM